MYTKKLLWMALLAGALSANANARNLLSPLPMNGQTNAHAAVAPDADSRTDALQFVRQKYKGCRILDSDYDDGLLEVKIRHQGREKIVLFDGNRWMRTLWEIRRERLPKNIVAALRKAGFEFRHLDDNDNYVVENRDGRFYAVQTQRNDRDDLYYVVSDKGRIVHRYSDDHWDDGRMHGKDRWDEDDEWNDEDEWDDGEDRFDEGDDEWDDRHRYRRHHDDDDDDDDDDD